MAVDKRAARLGALALVSVVLFGAVGTRLWFLQTVQRDSLQAQVNSGQTREQTLLPERGQIFDAKGRVLATNRRILTVTVERAVIRKLSNRTELFTRLSGLLQVPVEEMERRWDDGQHSQFLPLPVAEDVSEAFVIEIESRSEDYPGVHGDEDWARVYPYAPLASHVVGYMGLILKSQVERYRDLDYLDNESVGQFGIELSMEEELHGKSGKVVYEVDSANHVVREKSRVEPVPGKDIQLTIDLQVQQYAEQVLETQLKSRRQTTDPSKMAKNPQDKNGIYKFLEPEPWFYDDKGIQHLPYSAPAGSVVVQNYVTGQIIAMASYPTFDNRWFTVGLSRAKFKQLFPEPDKNDPNRADKSILVNRAIQGQYNLGSTFKPFVAYAGIMSGVIGPDETFNDTGSWKLDIDKATCNEGVRCEYFNALGPFGKPSAYGPVTVREALSVSSDSYFYRIGELMHKVKPSLLGDQLRNFGFAAKSGIDLPFEFTGRIPTSELKADFIDRGVLGKGESRNLVTGDNVQLSIGQGLLAASPLQLANAYSTIADGGFLHRPHIIKAIYQGGVPAGEPGYGDFTDATVLESFEAPEVIHQIDFPPEVRDPIVEGLTQVITGPILVDPSGGDHAPTGYYLFRNYPDDGLPLAGKTGTAQGADSKPWYDSSVFAAFSRDIRQPYTIVSYLEKAGYGAKAAAPLVKCMANALGQTGGVVMEEPVMSDPLDQTSILAAPPNELDDMSCAVNIYDKITTTRD